MTYFTSVLLCCACLLASPYLMANDKQHKNSTCLKVTLTGTNGGPNPFDGLTGPGTLVEFGAKPDCNEARLQFDAGRGSTLSLSKLGLKTSNLDLLAFTHLHSDHIDGFFDLIFNRWHITGINEQSNFPPLDILCSDPQKTKPPAKHTIDCKKLVANIGAPVVLSGEIAQRLSENPGRNAGGPSAITKVKELKGAHNTPAHAWSKNVSSGRVDVSYIRVNHIPGSIAYRVDTPAGSVVIGGDATNEKPIALRKTSTSDNVALLVKTPSPANVFVHSATSNILAPGSGYPPRFFERQSTAEDLGTLAKASNVQYLMLTHLIPAIGSNKAGPSILKSALTADDWKNEAAKTGFPRSNVIVGPDRTSLTLSNNP